MSQCAQGMAEKFYHRCGSSGWWAGHAGRASRGLLFLILVFQAGLMTAVFLFLRCHLVNISADAVFGSDWFGEFKS